MSAGVSAAAGIERAFYVGYSMGGAIGLRFLRRFQGRIGRLVLAGVGETYLNGPGASDSRWRDRIADGLLIENKDAVTDPRARMFRDFAGQPGKDRQALAACMRAMGPSLPPQILQTFDIPILAVCGERDAVAGAPGPLAAIFSHGSAKIVPGRDHMSAVGARQTREAAVEFLTA
ncbi:MAG: alpha/beta fold hydrolase [Rhizomicrobium sp.]